MYVYYVYVCMYILCVYMCMYECMCMYVRMYMFTCVCIRMVAFRGARGGIYPPENRMAPLGYVMCIVTYIILKRFMNHMMSHYRYLIKIKFLH